MSSSASGRTGARRRPETRLILYFDVNQTLIMLDPIQKKGSDEVVNEVLSETSWGRVENNAWEWNGDPPSHQISDPYSFHVTYTAFLDEMTTPSKLNKKQKKALIHRFTHDGSPGQALQVYANELRTCLKRPQNVDHCEAAKLAGLGDDNVFILPAFFELLIHLKQTNRPFNVVFRTFGMDIGSVGQEFNAFCEGWHPRYPGIILDGSDGGLDMRLDTNDPLSYGIFFRERDEIHLILGTTLELNKSFRKRGAGILQYSRIPGTTVVSSIPAVRSFMQQRLQEHGTMAIRDDHFNWAGADKAAHAGKLLLMDPSDYSEHPIFFDDNIGNNDAVIVDVRDVRTGKNIPFEKTGAFLVPVRQLDLIRDPSYFVRHVQACEARRSMEWRRKVWDALRLRVLAHEPQLVSKQPSLAKIVTSLQQHRLQDDKARALINTGTPSGDEMSVLEEESEVRKLEAEAEGSEGWLAAALARNSPRFAERHRTRQATSSASSNPLSTTSQVDADIRHAASFGASWGRFERLFKPHPPNLPGRLGSHVPVPPNVLAGSFESAVGYGVGRSSIEGAVMRVTNTSERHDENSHELFRLTKHDDDNPRLPSVTRRKAGGEEDSGTGGSYALPTQGHNRTDANPPSLSPMPEPQPPVQPRHSKQDYVRTSSSVTRSMPPLSLFTPVLSPPVSRPPRGRRGRTSTTGTSPNNNSRGRRVREGEREQSRIRRKLYQQEEQEQRGQSSTGDAASDDRRLMLVVDSTPTDWTQTALFCTGGRV